MPLFETTFKLVDDYGRESRKTWQVDALDVPTAQTEAGNLLTDLVNLTQMRVLQYSISLVTIVVDTVTPGANKDEGATFSVRKADNKKAAVKVPAPVDGVRNPDGTIDITNALVTGFFANFVGGAWRVSDGETATELLSGVLDQ